MMQTFNLELTPLSTLSKSREKMSVRFRLLTSDFKLLTSDFGLLTSDFKLRTSNFRLQTYSFIFYFLSFTFSFAQPTNNNCASSSLLCPNLFQTASNVNATAECGTADSCAQGLFCYTTESSSWFHFVTNSVGGTATVSVSSLNCGVPGSKLQGALLSASIPCNASSYSILDCNAGDTAFSLTPTASLLPNTVYYVQIDGVAGSMCNFQIVVLGPAVQWTLNTSFTGATCMSSCDGTATVSPQSGTPPYTYKWNTTPNQTTQTATGLCKQTYNVTVTDSVGCTSIATIPVDILPPATISFTTEDVRCICSGKATAELSSGPTPYTYKWNTTPIQTTETATGLCAQTYIITITDSVGCSTVDSTSINTLPPATINFTKTDLKCGTQNTGTATATLSAGKTPYIYKWNTTPQQSAQTATNLSNKTYKVTVTDAEGCKTVDLVTISKPDEITEILIVTTPVKCGAMGTATARPTGGTSPYSYEWSNGDTSKSITGLNEGQYYLTVTDFNNCTKSTDEYVSTDDCDMVGQIKFSPNGDGINDSWQILNANVYPNNLVTVYNRWGQVVYSETGYDNVTVFWDGKYLGVPVPDATYYYIIYHDKDNKNDYKIIPGSVTILR